MLSKIAYILGEKAAILQGERAKQLHSYIMESFNKHLPYSVRIPRSFEKLYSMGSRVPSAITRLVTGGALGAGAGAAVDTDNQARGAIIGGLMGTGLGALKGELLPHWADNIVLKNKAFNEALNNKTLTDNIIKSPKFNKELDALIKTTKENNPSVSITDIEKLTQDFMIKRLADVQGAEAARLYSKDYPLYPAILEMSPLATAGAAGTAYLNKENKK